MHFFECYFNNVIKYDLFNKFYFKNINAITKLKKVVLNFSINSSDFSSLITFLATFELIGNQKGVFTRSKTSNIVFKIQKGDPVGCKIVLRKSNMYFFASKFTLYILPSFKKFDGLFFSKKSKNSITLKFKNSLLFSELLSQYEMFKSLPFLSITFVGTSSSINELVFLLRSYKLPLNKPITF